MSHQQLGGVRVPGQVEQQNYLLHGEYIYLSQQQLARGRGGKELVGGRVCLLH